jgi:hypothetical protein
MRFLREKPFSPKSLRIAKKIEAHLVAQYAQTQIESQANPGAAHGRCRKLSFFIPCSLTFPQDLFIFIST